LCTLRLLILPPLYHPNLFEEHEEDGCISLVVKLVVDDLEIQ
jgi:hypothetical protein